MASMAPVFHGRVDEDGKLLLLDTEQTLRRVHLSRLKGRDVEVVIRKERVQRSLDQNAYIHAVPIPILADHFGYDVAEMKYVLMGECWGWKPDPISGHEIPVKASTSKMDVDECSYFIEWVVPWAMSNHGVNIPLPNEVDA